MAAKQANTQNDNDDDDKPKGGGALAEIFTPGTARAIKRAAPWVAGALLVLLVLRN